MTQGAMVIAKVTDSLKAVEALQSEPAVTVFGYVRARPRGSCQSVF